MADTVSTQPVTIPSSPAPSGPAPSQDASQSPPQGSQAVSDIVLDFENLDQGSAAPASQQTAAAHSSMQKPRTYRNDDEKKIFSQMSNEAYNKLYPLFVDHTDGKLIPKSQLEELERRQAEATKSRWYDHPNGYTLTEDYTKLNNNIILAQEALHHYGQMMQNVARQQPVQMIVQNDKGEWIIDKQQWAGDAAAQAFIAGEIAKFNTMLQSSQDKLDDYKNSFSGKFDAIKQGLQSVDDQIFGRYKDNASFNAAVDRELGYFLPELRSMPEYRLLAKASVFLKALNQSMNANRQKSMAGATHQNNAFGGGGATGTSAAQQLEDLVNGARR